MKLAAQILLTSLVLAALLALPAQSQDQVAAGAGSREEIVEQILSLQQAIELLVASHRGEDEASSQGTGAEELAERLRALRRAIDDLLARLASQSPEGVPDSGSRPAAEGQVAPPSIEGEPQREEARVETPQTPALPRAISTAESLCAEFQVFDTNEDGVVSGFDRYWRYFRLWRDDGDGLIEERELSRLYDAGVGEIKTTLGTYRTLDGVAGDVLGGTRIRLDLAGKNGGMAVLAIDADRLARGGQFELRDAAGEALSGLQPLSSEMTTLSADGTSRPLSCPE